MNIFFLKIINKSLILSLLFIIIISGVIIFKTNTPIILDKYKGEIILKKKIQIAIFGDSEIHGALDSKILQNKLNMQTNNFANGGQTVFTNVLKIRDFLKFNPNSIIIFDYGSNDVSYRGDMRRDEGNLFNPEAFKFSFSNYFQFMSFEEIYFFLINFPKETLQSIFKGTFQYNYFLHSGVDLNFNSKIDEAKVNIEKSIKSRDSLMNSKHIFDEYFPFNKLNETVINNPKTTFIILHPPEHQLNKLIFKSDSLKWLENTRILKENKNTIVLNYKDFKLDDEDFEDFSHLTISGKKKFSEELSKALKLIINNKNLTNIEPNR